MKRIFLRHGDYRNSPVGIRILNETGFQQAISAGEHLGVFARSPQTLIVASDRDRAIETALFLIHTPEKAHEIIEGLRTDTESMIGECRYFYLGEDLGFRICKNCVEILPSEWAGYQGDLLFVGHEPAARRLNLQLSEGQFGEW